MMLTIEMQVLFLTVTSLLIVFFNIYTMIMSSFNLYFNGSYFKRQGNIREDIRQSLITSFFKTASALIPAYIWLTQQSFLQIGFEQAVFWNMWHLWAVRESYLVNKIACKVGIKNCYEIQSELLKRKEVIYGFITVV